MLYSTLPFLIDNELIFNFVWKIYYPNIRIMFVLYDFHDVILT